MIEKSILVYYMNRDGMSNNIVDDLIQASFRRLQSSFVKEIANDELTILIIPVFNQPTKIELLNAKYPNWEEFQHKIEELKLYENEYEKKQD